jgi:2-polyprenyl-3-methyl-5-hydroxy-6-metoxy-1,4-benzoquinol methylase
MKFVSPRTARLNAAVNADAPGSISRSCPVCAEAGATPLWHKGDLRVVRCASCGMAYTSPVDHAAATGEFYDRLAAPFYLSPAKLESDFAPVRFARELRLFRAYCPRGAVLDVGCSTGAFLHQLRQRFPNEYAVTGTDVARAALDHAAGRGIEVVRGAFPELDFGGRHFDAITFWAVLEHLVDPLRFLRHAARLLRPGGACFVLVPNLGSLAVRLAGPRYRYVMPDHVNYFSAASLRQLIARVPEFECVALRFTHFNPIVIWQDFRAANVPARVPDAERAALLARTTAWKQRPGLAPLGWIYGVTEGLLACLGLADNIAAVLRRR